MARLLAGGWTAARMVRGSVAVIAVSARARAPRSDPSSEQVFGEVWYAVLLLEACAGSVLFGVAARANWNSDAEVAEPTLPATQGSASSDAPQKPARRDPPERPSSSGGAGSRDIRPVEEAVEVEDTRLEPHNSFPTLAPAARGAAALRGRLGGAGAGLFENGVAREQERMGTGRGVKSGGAHCLNEGVALVSVVAEIERLARRMGSSSADTSEVVLTRQDKEKNYVTEMVK